MKQSRVGTFETNSSSSHALVISETADYNMTIIPNEADGSITIPAIDFDEAEEQVHFNDPLTKASYLVAGILEPYNEDVLGSSYLGGLMDLLLETIKEHTGARVVKYALGGDQGNVLDPGIFEEAFKSKDTLKRYLFNNGSSMIIHYKG
ncbi:MAG: hypothetical protein H8D23_11085 [Candidatus Brocadiales bacterium]|nr:hypothetical protein [Candidatus Brocadiales bacterium]